MKTDIKHRHDCLYDTKVKGCVHYDFECAKCVHNQRARRVATKKRLDKQIIIKGEENYPD